MAGELFKMMAGVEMVHVPYRRSAVPAINSRRPFDHLVGNRQQARRNGKAERLGGLQIEDELEFSRLHNRKIARFFTVQYSADIDADGCTVPGAVFKVLGTYIVEKGKPLASPAP